MKTQSTFAGWDFATTWLIREGIAYPRLQWQLVRDIAGSMESIFSILPC